MQELETTGFLVEPVSVPVRSLAAVIRRRPSMFHATPDPGLTASHAAMLISSAASAELLRARASQLTIRLH